MVKALAVQIEPGVCIPKTTEMLSGVVGPLVVHLHKKEGESQSTLTSKSKHICKPWAFLRDAVSMSKRVPHINLRPLHAYVHMHPHK